MIPCLPAGLFTELKKRDAEEGRLWYEYIIKQAESKIEITPWDADIRGTWASAVYGLTYFENSYSYDQLLLIINDAIDALNGAFQLESCSIDLFWLWGKVLTAYAYLTLDPEEADHFFERATEYFQNAVNLDPDNELFKFSLMRSKTASERHLTRILGGPDALASFSVSSLEQDVDAADTDSRLFFEYAKKTAEFMISNDPKNVDNITTLATILLEFPHHKDPSEAMEMIQVAISKLEYALEVDPANPYVHWCYGKALTAQSRLSSDPCTGREIQSFQKAVDLDQEDPKTELFKYSLDKSSKAREPDMLHSKDVLQELRGQESSTCSKAMAREPDTLHSKDVLQELRGQESSTCSKAMVPMLEIEPVQLDQRVLQKPECHASLTIDYVGQRFEHPEVVL